MVVVLITGVVYEFPVATTVFPNAVVYHVSGPGGGFPIVDAVNATEPPEQMVSFAAIISKKDELVVVVPAPPAVAPLGGKLVTCVEFVVPFVPPMIF